jgi:HD-GYP domain-containing protein (c-di-GMP phosphodiesterase class II)
MENLLNSLLFKGRACRELGLVEESRRYFEKCLQASWLEGNLSVMANVVNEMGNLCILEGKLDQAKEFFDKALNLARKLDGNGLAGTVLKNLAGFNSLLGKFGRKVREIDTRVATTEQEKEWRRAARSYYELGTAFAQEERPESAIPFFSRCIRMAKREEERELFFESCLAISLSLVKVDRCFQALSFVRRALATAKRSGDPQKITRGIIAFATIERIRGDWKRAEKALRRVEQICGASVPSVCHADILREAGLLEASKGQWKSAFAAMAEAHEMLVCIKGGERDAFLEMKLREVESCFYGAAKSVGQVVDMRCSEAPGHSERVARFGIRLADEIGLSPDESKGVFIAGFLHDVGMLKADRDMVGKLYPGVRERSALRNHPVWGQELLEGIEFPWKVKQMIHAHHERCDGSGYPEELSGEEMPVGARVLAIADVYDVLTSPGHERRAYTGREALDIMEREMKGKFDERIFKVFKSMILEKRGVGMVKERPTPSCASVGRSGYGWRSDLFA